MLASLVFLIEQLAVGLYIIIAIMIVLNLRKVMIFGRAFRATHYELERDFARYRRANAITTIILLIQGIIVIFGIQTIVAPTIRDTVVTQNVVAQEVIDIPFYTPTPAPLSQINIDPSGVEFAATNPADAIRVTPIPTNTPPGTIEPNAPQAIGCDTDFAQLVEPVNGMKVHQLTTVLGTAYGNNFSKYKLEISGPQTNNQYASFQEVIQPVETLGTLSQFNPLGYAEGWYLFRLAVFDQLSEMTASCAINIYISPPIPTETPIPLD